MHFFPQCARQLALPATEDIRVELVLIAQIGDRGALQEAPSEDVELLLPGEPPSCAHGHLPGSPSMLTGESVMPIAV